MSAALDLDLGTAAAWALRAVDGQIVSGTQSFKAGLFDGAGGERLARSRF